MAKRARESLERGPRPITGVEASGTTGELPAVDLTLGDRQRYRVRVPTESTTLLLGARVPVARVEDDTQQLGYDGVTGVTNAHIFGFAARSATVQSAQRVYLTSTDDALAMVARGDAVVGGRASVTFAASGPVFIVAGHGPNATTVSTSGESPESASHADYSALANTYSTAAAVTTASVGLLFAGLVLAGTVKKTDLLSILSYASKAVSIISKTKVLVEQATGRTVARPGKRGVEIWSRTGDPSEVVVHGKEHVAISAGLLASTTLFAPLSSVNLVGALTAGLAGGVVGSIGSSWSASVYSLGFSTLQSIMSAGVAAGHKATIESRMGRASIAAPRVTIGDIVPVSPQAPTVAATIAGAMKVDFEVAGGTTALHMNGLLNDAKAAALTKLALTCLPWKLEITPLGVTIKALTSGATVAPAKLVLDQVTAKVELAPTGIQATATPHSVQITPTLARVKGPFIVLG